jgi:hypothetical protein
MELGNSICMEIGFKAYIQHLSQGSSSQVSFSTINFEPTLREGTPEREEIFSRSRLSSRITVKPECTLTPSTCTIR